MSITLLIARTHQIANGDTGAVDRLVVARLALQNLDISTLPALTHLDEQRQDCRPSLRRQLALDSHD